MGKIRFKRYPEEENLLLSGAKMMVKGLEEEGVVLAFGIPGVGILELFDAFRESSIKTVLVTHEQSASFMADAYNKVTGKVGVCCSIGGPGLTNMLTGLAEAYLDSSAVVVIQTVLPNVELQTN